MISIILQDSPQQGQEKSILCAFLEAIEQQKPFELDGQEARKSVELILRIYESAGIRKQGRFHKQLTIV